MQTARGASTINGAVKQHPIVHSGDVSEEFVDAARRNSLVAWDIETSGLDWRTDRVGLCQAWTAEYGLEIVKIDQERIPKRLAMLLQDHHLKKIFHHAMFDLRFLRHRWHVAPASIACTKIASKLLAPGRPPEEHTLASLLDEHLAVVIDKTQRTSDWLRSDLSPEQVAYAGNDVIYLPKLFAILMEKLRTKGLEKLACRCFEHIPTQVQLDVAGYIDIFGY